MDVISNLGLGFAVALTIQNIAYCFIGVLLGTIIGVLPGIGPVTTVAMLLPISFTLQPESALILLAGIYYGAQYGGSTTAILVNIPGEASSVVTTIDGHQMARRGRAGPALGIAALGSFFAGCVSTLLARGPAARGHRLAVRPGGIFLADGVRLGRSRRSGARIARQSDRDGRARFAPRPRRHRREYGRTAVQFRHDGTCRRHRVRGDLDGDLRHRRGRLQSRKETGGERRLRRARQGMAEPR